MKVGYNDRAVGGVSGPTKEQFYFTFYFTSMPLTFVSTRSYFILFILSFHVLY